jgi:hypothetical protein
MVESAPIVLDPFQTRKIVPKVSVHGLRSARSAAGSVVLRHPIRAATLRARNMQVRALAGPTTAPHAMVARDRLLHHTPHDIVAAVRQCTDSPSKQNRTVKAASSY